MSRERKKSLKVSVFLRNLEDLINSVPTSPGHPIHWEKLREKKQLALLSLEQLATISGEGPDETNALVPCSPKVGDFPGSFLPCDVRRDTLHLIACEIAPNTVGQGRCDEIHNDLPS